MITDKNEFNNLFDRRGTSEVLGRADLDSALLERDTARLERDEIKLQKECLQNQNVSLENDKVAQDKFVATVSHDLRNPIGAIKMAIDVLRDGANKEVTEQLIDLIDRNADEAGNLINHLLHAHLIRSGHEFPLEKIDCDLSAIIRKCRRSLVPEQQERIVLNFSERQYANGYWDPDALERVFKNLISNAIKFSKPKSNIIISITQAVEFTNVAIQNYGEIITPQNQVRIFNSHVRLSQDDPEKKVGWGLGLTLVKGIVEAHSGKVEVSSNKIEGTIFTLKIPTDLRLV